MDQLSLVDTKNKKELNFSSLVLLGPFFVSDV